MRKIIWKEFLMNRSINDRIKLMSITLLLVLLVGKMKAQEVTMQSLLREMVDREKRTEIPTEVPYRP